MNTIKEDFTTEDILTGLYKLANVGASRTLNIDLASFEKASSEKLSIEGLITLALAGCDTDAEREFCELCLSRV